MKDGKETPRNGGRYARPIFGPGGKQDAGRRVFGSQTPGKRSAPVGGGSRGAKGRDSGQEFAPASGAPKTSAASETPKAAKGSEASPRLGAAAARSVAVPRRGRLGLQGQLLLFSLLALLVIGGGAWWYLRPVEAVVVLDSYQYATVGSRDFRDLIVAQGRVEPETVTLFVAPVEGTVEEVFVEVGQDVDPGAPLVQLVSTTLLEELDKAHNAWEEALLDLEQARLKNAGDVLAKERDLEEARQALTDAEDGLPLTRRLFALGGVSGHEMQEAEAEIQRLQLRVDNAQQALALAEAQAELALRQAEQKARAAERSLAKLQEQRDEMTVRADVAGRVLSLSVREGQRVPKDAELLRHADVTRQEVHTAVTPEQAARLEPGTSALLRVGGRNIPAEVSFVAPLAQTSGDRAAVPVRLALDPESAATVRPFTEVSVELELGVRRGRPALARGPFFASGDASFVYVLSEDGTRAERRDVRYGAIDGNFVEITAGLEPGDQIVYSSYTAFRTHPTVELIREGGRSVE